MTYPCDRCNMDEGSPVCLQDDRCPKHRPAPERTVASISDDALLRRVVLHVVRKRPRRYEFPGNATAWGCPECVREMREELAALRKDAERWRYWRNFWPALCRMEVARFARLDLSKTHVQSPTEMDRVTDAAMAQESKT